MASSTTPTDAVKDKVILVTGANRGIGKAFVDVFLQHGAKKVYAAVRNLQSLEKDADDRIVPLYMDLSKPETIVEACQHSQDVDILINNAGILSRTDVLDPNATVQLQLEFQVNVFGFMSVAQTYAPYLKNGGILIQINSVASFRCGMPEVCTYSTSKAAAYSVTQALKQSLAPQQTRVISVHPGPIATDMIKDCSPELAKQAEDPKQVAELVIEAIQDGSTFHVFPDSKSKRLGAVLEPYLKSVIEDGKMYG